MKQVLIIINTFFGILLFLIFFSVFISIFLLPRLIIADHNFNTPAVLATLLFFCILVVFLLKPILKHSSGIKMTFHSGLGYWLTISFIAVFVLLFGYFTIYLPLTSTFLGEIDFNSQKIFSFQSETGKKLYFEVDAGPYDEDGTQIKAMIIGPENWSSEKTYTVAKKSPKRSEKRTAISGTTLTAATDALPADGEYQVIFEQLNNNVNIQRIRIFEK